MRATQYSAFSFSLIARYTLSERKGKLSPERLTAVEVTFVGICFLCYRRCAVKGVQGAAVHRCSRTKWNFVKCFPIPIYGFTFSVLIVLPGICYRRESRKRWMTGRGMRV